MLGNSRFWGSGRQFAPSQWLNWQGTLPDETTFSISSDVYGGPNNNQFAAAITNPYQGIATWSPYTGYYEWASGNATNTKYYRAFTINFTDLKTITVGPPAVAFSMSNMNMNVTNAHMTAVDDRKAVSSFSYNPSFATYSSQFQLITVDQYSQELTVVGPGAVDTSYMRVSDQAYMGSGRLLAAMEAAPGPADTAFAWVSWTATDIVARPMTGAPAFRAGQIYPLTGDTFAAVGRLNGPNTNHLKIFRITWDAIGTSTLTELATYALSKTNQGILFQSPGRFLTYWGSGPVSVGELLISGSYQISEGSQLLNSLGESPWSAGRPGFTLDGTAFVQYQIAGSYLCMRVVDIGNSVTFGSWRNVTPFPSGFLNTTYGAVPIDSSRFLFGFTDTAFTTGPAAGRLKVIKR